MVSEQFGGILDTPQGLHGKNPYPGFWHVHAGQWVESAPRGCVAHAAWRCAMVLSHIVIASHDAPATGTPTRWPIASKVRIGVHRNVIWRALPLEDLDKAWLAQDVSANSLSPFPVVRSRIAHPLAEHPGRMAAVGPIMGQMIDPCR